MLQERGIQTATATATGEPATAIARLAEERKADLVVIGTRGLGPVQRLLGRASARRCRDGSGATC